MMIWARAAEWLAQTGHAVDLGHCAGLHGYSREYSMNNAKANKATLEGTVFYGVISLQV
jgi:hypothetical protein